MHELWLCKSILEIVKQQAIETKCVRVKKVILEIGQLSAVDEDALNFSFNVVTQGTVAQNAELQIIVVSGEALCEICHKIVPVKNYYDECQYCGKHSLSIKQGEELKVKSMVVE